MYDDKEVKDVKKEKGAGASRHKYADPIVNRAGPYYLFGTSVSRGKGS